MQQHFLSSQKLFIPIVLRSTILNISISPSISSTLVPKWRRVSQFHANERTNERTNEGTDGRTDQLTVIIVYQFWELFPKQIRGGKGYERPPWSVDRGGCQREIGPTRTNQPVGRTRRKKGDGGGRGTGGASTTRVASPAGWWGWKPAELLPSGSEWGPRELGQGKTTLNPRYQPPGAISAYQLSLSVLLPSSLSLSFSLSLSQSFLLLLARARQHRYPTTSLKYLSLPGGLTRVKWYRDTWTRDYWFFDRSRWRIRRSRLKYRPQWNARSAVGYIVFGTGEKPAPSVARELPRIEGVILLFEIVRGLGVCGNCCWS